MRGKRVLLVGLLAAGAVVPILARVVPPTPAPSSPPSLSLPIRWVRGAEPAGPEGLSRMRSGLLWALSNLGALPPREVESFLRDVVETPEGARFTLDLAAAGFPVRARAALARAIEPLRASDELSLHGAVDAGRFLMATVHQPWRYYEITLACSSLEDWKARHLHPAADTYAVTLSQLTTGHRRVLVNPVPPDETSVSGIAFLAAEGTGSLADGTFQAQELETLDVMPNGQQRFALYGLDGALKPAASPDLTPAGQPGKCQWCHEMRLQLGTPANPAAAGSLTTASFQERIHLFQDRIERYRRTLETSVDFETYRVHQWAEEIVEEFLSPSPERLSREWSVPVGRVVSALSEAGLVPHRHPEFPAWGDLYRRADADRVFERLLPELAGTPGHPLFGRAVASYRPVAVLPSARETVPELLALDGSEAVERLLRCGAPVRPAPPAPAPR